VWRRSSPPSRAPLPGPFLRWGVTGVARAGLRFRRWRRGAKCKAPDSDGRPLLVRYSSAVPPQSSCSNRANIRASPVSPKTCEAARAGKTLRPPLPQSFLPRIEKKVFGISPLGSIFFHPSSDVPFHVASTETYCLHHEILMSGPTSGVTFAPPATNRLMVVMALVR